MGMRFRQCTRCHDPLQGPMLFASETRRCKSCREEKVRSGRCGRLEAKDASVTIPSTLSNDVLVLVRTESSKRLKRQTRPEHRRP